MQAPLSHTASAEHLFSSLPLPDGGLSPHKPSSAGVHPFSGGGSAAEVADGIGLAHDAGNLLGAIRLYCDLLALPGVLRSEHRHYADELLRLTARSGSLIDRLLRPAVRATPARLTESATERLRLADAVMACRGMLEPVAGTGCLSITVEAGAKTEVALPREALERILLNLIKNAVEARGADAMDRGRDAVSVRVRAVAGWGPGYVDAVAVSVEDRGRGMDEGVARAVVSGERDGPRTADGECPGRGIGLRVVRELTARTGGELRIWSRPGQGTTVEIVWAAVPRDGADSG